MPGCGVVSQGGKPAARGRAAGLWVTELWPWGAAFPCGILGSTRLGTPAPPQPLQTRIPVYHTDQLSCRLFALRQYAEALVQIKTAPVSVGFPVQNKVRQTGQQTRGVEEG